MNEYLVIIRGGEEIAATKSAEEMQEHMGRWQDWLSGMPSEETFVGGEPLMEEGKTLIDGGKTIIDRPLAEGKELVGGYLIFKAKSLDEATELAKGCPGFEHDCTLEVRQIRPVE
ncbi:hypothetical protein FUAX_02460 [Fulvitalea axinellae]|uniref:YCII-related domain-containing protein n=1 Tax=Fulvitalea axinellae TaxID=1182444 RepID=A0AAU9C731_9BACT|nr:hypothetical protein FUAX_02460 [Fulvitalea axinellae]